MYKHILLAGTIIILSGIISIHAQNGFVVWTNDRGGCQGELVFNKIENGKVGERKTAVIRQVTNDEIDSWVHISYDGVWIAFCRVDSTFQCKHFECDGCPTFKKWILYIARIDNGESLPATPIKVGRGYWPSWGDNAYDPDKPKTLYFTHYESKTIKKTIINPDGTFTTPVDYHKLEQKTMGVYPQIQMSPNGKFLLYRSGKMKVYSLELKKDISGDLDGCCPCWGPRSRYFLRRNEAFLNLGTSVKNLGNAGVGMGWGWQGISNDSYYNEGKLWIIGSINKSGENNSIEFIEIDISNGGWKFGPSTKVGGRGKSCDIHIWGPDGPTKTSISPGKFNNSMEITTGFHIGMTGMELIIQSIGPVYSAGLYDLKGRQWASVWMRNKAKNIIPLHDVENGMYLIQLNTIQGSINKTIQIIR